MNASDVTPVVDDDQLCASTCTPCWQCYQTAAQSSHHRYNHHDDDLDDGSLAFFITFYVLIALGFLVLIVCISAGPVYYVHRRARPVDLKDLDAEMARPLHLRRR
jgi:hypothetical protein